VDEMTSDERATEELAKLFEDPADLAAVHALADAERAVAQHAATARQVAGVSAAGDERSPEDRVRAWRSATGS
jgi:16S rRNA C1402 (ribose-2'-O) methylase RsmI